MAAIFKTAQDAATYAMAGNATLTLSSRKTGAHYTVKVVAPKDAKMGDTVRFVRLLTGPENTIDYTYVGMLRDGDFRLTAKSKLSADAPAVRAISYFAKHVLHGNLPEQLEVRHEGSCGRCGRVLTVPESVDRGIGPECAKHVH